MNNLLKNTALFILFLLVQVVILNEVPPIHQFITPYIYFVFLLWLPFGTSRISTLFLDLYLAIALIYLPKPLDYTPLLAV